VSWRSRPRCQSFSVTAAVSFLLRWFPLLRTIILWDDCAHLIPVLALLSSEGLKSFSIFSLYSAVLFCQRSGSSSGYRLLMQRDHEILLCVSQFKLSYFSLSLSAAPSGFASWLIWLPPPPLYCHRLCHPQPGPRVPKPSKPLPLQLYTMWCDAPILSRVSPFWFHSTIDILTLANRDRAQSMLRLEERKKEGRWEREEEMEKERKRRK
jgi:hypothetical protein